MIHTLDIPEGITAIIGSGGKTTLLMQLARQLPGRRIVCTTTKIYPPGELPLFSGKNPLHISAALREFPAVCVGARLPSGKLGPPACPLSKLRTMADYVLVEADGSRGLPLKAHLSHEPVIPPEAERVLLVAGLSGLGRPIREAAHRPEHFAALCCKHPGAPVTAEDVARVIAAEGLADTVILNQMDAGSYERAVKEIASLLSAPVFAGSLKDQHLTLL